MNTHIQYGIDLGTTNSAIARIKNGIPEIIKTDSTREVLPSYVHINKKKDILVGDPAVRATKTATINALRNFKIDDINSFFEFKRTMGTEKKYYSSILDKYFSSEELSAEILKRLKTFVRDDNFHSVVITVPAKFTNPQNEATIRAAKLAGFKQVHLLQEPVAAATAYGISTKIKNGYFLVFDFGGGTFDAALLKSDDGILSIKDTEGDNFLGGKNIDELIVDEIFIPYLRKLYKIDYILKDELKRDILRNALKWRAEEAKIQLSFNEIWNITSDLGEFPFKDENDNEIEIDLTITQLELEKLVKPIFQKAINICKDLLERNNLKEKDLSSIILVGGPTYSPILRNMIKEQLTKNIECSIDPMTVVARGAALFASTIHIDEQILDLNRDNQKLQLEINYEATTVENEEFISVKVLRDKTIGKIPDKIFIELKRVPEGFSTGLKQIGDKPTIIELYLEENCPNEFRIFTYDELSNPIPCEPDKFTILQGISGIDGLQSLAYNICIVKYFPDEEKDLIIPVKGLEKNRSIKSGIVGVVDNLRTRQNIRPGIKGDVIRIPIYQGEYNSPGTNPDLNIHITDVIITGEDLPKFLPAGSPVNIRIKVHPSLKMTFIAEFPTIDFEKEIEITDIKPNVPSKEDLAKKIDDAIDSADDQGDSDIVEQLERLEDELETTGTSDDGRLKISNDFRKLLLQLELRQKQSRWPKIEEELKNEFYRLEELIEIIKNDKLEQKLRMDKINELIKEFRNKIDLVLKEKNYSEAKRLIEDIRKATFEITYAVAGNLIDVQYFKSLADNFSSYHWTNPARARQLIQQGYQLIANNNIENIRPIVIELINLLPDNERPKETLE